MKRQSLLKPLQAQAASFIKDAAVNE